MVRVVQGNFYTDLSVATLHVTRILFNLWSSLVTRRVFRSLMFKKMKVMKCKSKVCSENILSPNAGSISLLHVGEVVDSLVLC